MYEITNERVDQGKARYIPASQFLEVGGIYYANKTLAKIGLRILVNNTKGTVSFLFDKDLEPMDPSDIEVGEAKIKRHLACNPELLRNFSEAEYKLVK